MVHVIPHTLAVPSPSPPHPGLTVLRPPLGPPDAVAHAPLTGRAERYATVVQSLSQSPADTEPVARFEQACLEDGGVGDKRATMHGVWQLLRSVVAEGNGVDAMVQGARRYLHGGFVTYINNVIKVGCFTIHTHTHSLYTHTLFLNTHTYSLIVWVFLFFCVHVWGVEACISTTPCPHTSFLTTHLSPTPCTQTPTHPHNTPSPTQYPLTHTIPTHPHN